MSKGKKYFLYSLLSMLIILVLTGWFAQVQSQGKYPTRAIDIIVGFNPGGSTDLSSRVLAEYLKKEWKVPVNVINKPGGMSVPAVLEAYKAKPNGYTLLADNNSCSSLMQISIEVLPFKVMERTFIGTFGCQQPIAIVPSDSPFRSLKDVAIEAKKDPENFTWVSLGGVSSYDVMLRQFFKEIGVDISKTKPLIVTGGSRCVAMAAGGHVKFAVGSMTASLPAIKGGTVRPLAVAGKDRYPDLPEVPTTAEAGYPTVSFIFLSGISGPPNMPSHIVDKFNNVLQKMLKNPEVVSNLRKVGIVPFYLNSLETKEYYRKEIEELKGLWGVK